MTSHKQPFSLVKASFLSFIIAMIVLVLFILPAEYDIDVTGAGKALGLTAFTQAQAAPVVGEEPQTTSTDDEQKDMVQLTVPKGRGIEYKLYMDQFEQVTYDWEVSSDQLYVDLHGEPKGDTTGYFKSYTIATVDKMNGSFVAPFDGVHGWYWRNKTDKDIVVTLKFEGQYKIKGLIQ